MREASFPLPNIARAARLAIVLAVAAIVATACRSTAQAGPTPATFTGVVASLSEQGISIENVVSGEAGCDDRALVSAAIAFDARGLDQSTPVRVHLYTFGNGAAFNRFSPNVDACARVLGGTGSFTRIDQSPYVAAGSGTWGTQFKSGIKTALSQAIPLGP